MSVPTSNLTPAQQHRKKHNQLVRLSGEQVTNPYSVIEEFFSCYHLTDSRKMLEAWLKVGLTIDDVNFECGRQRSDLFFFYEKIEELLEAVFLLQEQHQMRNKVAKA